MESIRGSSSAAISAMSSVRSSKPDTAFESPSHKGERANPAGLSKQFKNLELGIQRSGWEMRQIDARYRLIKKLKGGAMAVVYLADDITSTVVKHQVVLKVLQAGGTFEQRQRMVREVSLVARVKHPNVVHYQDAAEQSDGTMFIAMSVIHGRDLQRVLDVNKQLHPVYTIEVVTGVLKGLKAIHEQLIAHRS
jgi:serine/threonine protein kinase